MAKIKIITKIGDVFFISLKNNHKCYGQIIGNKNGIIAVIVFGKLYDEKDNPSITEIIAESPLFFAHTFEIRLCDGKWKIIGNYLSNINSFYKPFYKLGTKDDARLVNYDDEFIRPISPDEFEELSYRPTISEVGLENAINGYFKLGTWYDSDKKYLYEYVLKSKLIAENG
jgi:hypothetical protein